MPELPKLYQGHGPLPKSQGVPKHSAKPMLGGLRRFSGMGTKTTIGRRSVSGKNNLNPMPHLARRFGLRKTPTMLTRRPGRQRKLRHMPTLLMSGPSEPTTRTPAKPISESVKPMRPKAFLAAAGDSDVLEIRMDSQPAPFDSSA